MEMFASIHSIAVEGDSRGKTSLVESEKIGIDLKSDLTNRYGQSLPPYLEITARCTISSTTGAKGGTLRDSVSTFKLRLNAEELQQIFEHAIQSKLFAPPGQTEVAQAAELIATALAIMSGHDTTPKN